MVSMLIAIVVAVTLFWTLLYALFGRREKEGLSVDMFIAMWRTKRLLGFIDRLSRVNPLLEGLRGC